MAFRLEIKDRPVFVVTDVRKNDLASVYLMEVIAGKTAVRESGCWEWCGWQNMDGYGHFKIAGKIRRVHRLVYECCIGIVPDGKLILHNCDNPPCCNPAHLYLGDEKDNIMDCVKRGRHSASILTEEQVREIKRDTAPSRPEKRNYQHYKYLAKKYGVSVETIKGLVYGQTWGHIKDGHGSGG